MKPIECEFEAEVLAAVLQSRWPDRADADLRAHVLHCDICSDVAMVAGAIDDAREEMRAAVAVPDAGRVWWLARLRARREAAEVASHAITATQLIAMTCVVGLLGACFGATSLWFQSALRSIVFSVARLDLTTLLALLVEHGALAAGMAVVLFVVPAAVYLAMGRD
jgi:hypothetical protein